jgi:tRNA (guanine37-N1)-methyltransferase
MVVIDAVTRLIPGVLGGESSAERESFSDGLLEHAHFTRPPVFEGEKVPEVLLGGHHGKIEQWRRESALMRTLVNRPDLLTGRKLTAEEKDILRGWQARLGRLIGPPADASGPAGR